VEFGRRSVLRGMGATSVLAAIGLGTREAASASAADLSTAAPEGSPSGSSALSFDTTAWNFDATNDVYWQLGRSYVTQPAATDYETLGIYVPGAYLTATPNGDGTYTATPNPSGSVGGFTAATAPILFPVNTPGYAAQRPPTAYSWADVGYYVQAGFVYVYPGLRGQDTETATYSGNAPWGVTDLKAAVRYVRYNAHVLPGDQDRVVVFGMSGGGAQSTVMGASGDSKLYRPYLESLGAAMTDARGRRISDAVAGVMAWCPITSLDQANAAYEWNMGQFASTGTRAAGTWTAAYSQDLAKAFAGYVNQLKLRGPGGRTLSLRRSSRGVRLAGSYYDHVVSVITQSLNDFLSDTTFPYTPVAGPGGPPGTPPTGGSTTYATAADYIASLNTPTTWVDYDATANTATVTGLAGFVQSQKNASKDVGAFDGIARQQTENHVHGLNTYGLHFAPESAKVIAAREGAYAKLTGWNPGYGAHAYQLDFASRDSLGQYVEYRTNMYNPMYYLSRYYDGYRSSKVAPHWRIRTGIAQGDTANTVEINLVLALAGYGVKDVDFATVWAQHHVEAERTGDPTLNFIAWVKDTFA
jgi:hypothetical protein